MLIRAATELIERGKKRSIRTSEPCISPVFLCRVLERAYEVLSQTGLEINLQAEYSGSDRLITQSLHLIEYRIIEKIPDLQDIRALCQALRHHNCDEECFEILCASYPRENGHITDLILRALRKQVPFLYFLSDEDTNNSEFWARVRHLLKQVILDFIDDAQENVFEWVRDFDERMDNWGDLVRAFELLDISESAQSKVKYFSHLKNRLQERLLIPGASTSDLIEMYLKVIRVMQLFNRLGNCNFLMEIVGEPISRYLIVRPDTISCIISLLCSIQQENITAGEDQSPDAKDIWNDDNSDYEGLVAFEFKTTSVVYPEPLLNRQHISSGRKIPTDAILLLVGIYGAQELFLQNYRVTLCERLLNATTFDVDNESANVELFKSRFGDRVVTDCDVMISDITESRRICLRILELRKAPKTPHLAGSPPDSNLLSSGMTSESWEDIVRVDQIINLETNVNEEADTEARDLETPEFFSPGVRKMTLVVMSSRFWPSKQYSEANYKPPGLLANAFIEFNRLFPSVRANRTLCWRPSLGLVMVTVTSRNGDEIRMTLSPAHAAILFCFGHSEEEERRGDPPKRRTLDELVGEVNLPIAFILRRVRHLVINHMIDEIEPHTYVGREHFAQSRDSRPNFEEFQDDANAADAEPECAIMCVKFILGMLTNFGSLDKDKIEGNLKLFMSDPPYTLTEEELDNVLSKMVLDNLVSKDGPSYSIRRA